MVRRLVVLQISRIGQSLTYEALRDMQTCVFLNDSATSIKGSNLLASLISTKHLPVFTQLSYHS